MEENIFIIGGPKKKRETQTISIILIGEQIIFSLKLPLPLCFGFREFNGNVRKNTLFVLNYRWFQKFKLLKYDKFNYLTMYF